MPFVQSEHSIKLHGDRELVPNLCSPRRGVPKQYCRSQCCSQSSNCSSFTENPASLKTLPRILPNTSFRRQVAVSTSIEKDLYSFLKLLPPLLSSSGFFSWSCAPCRRKILHLLIYEISNVESAMVQPPKNILTINKE